MNGDSRRAAVPLFPPDYRASGILLHASSLPSPYGIGDFFNPSIGDRSGLRPPLPRKERASRRVRIPKSAGGTRNLGIPTVIDRVIQQAVLQRLQPQWDPTFSEHSYGFRPGRSAHQAQAYVIEGYRVVVDI